MKICTECEEELTAAWIKTHRCSAICRNCEQKKEQNAPAPYVQTGYFAIVKQAGGSYGIRPSKESTANGEWGQGGE